MRTPRFLVIRRDNIGDLVCTTPMIRTLRQHYPEARIDALVNTYNAPVLDGNPDVDAVHVYMKAKHREAGRSVIRVYGDRVALFWRLRRERYDYAILAGSGYQARALRTARMVGATHVIGFVHERDYAGPIDRPLWKDPAEVVHEVEIVQRLLRSLGIDEPPPALRLVADARASAQARAGLAHSGVDPQRLVGLHISSRLPEQRWPSEKFAALAHALHARHRCGLLLFWSPGADDNPLHPGDDLKAQAVLDACRHLPIQAYRTAQLRELITGLSLCDTVICSDGGAMHLAAGLGKRIVCFFGAKGSPQTWHPWTPCHVLLHSAPHDVATIEVEQVLEAYAAVQRIPPA